MIYDALLHNIQQNHFANYVLWRRKNWQKCPGKLGVFGFGTDCVNVCHAAQIKYLITAWINTMVEWRSSKLQNQAIFWTGVDRKQNLRNKNKTQRDEEALAAIKLESTLFCRCKRNLFRRESCRNDDYEIYFAFPELFFTYEDECIAVQRMRE